MSASTVAASPIPTSATSTVQKVPWATKRALAVKHESLSAIHFDNGTSIEALFMHPVLHKRAISQSYSTFEELPAKCLYIPGSQLPDKCVGCSLTITLLVLTWSRQRHGRAGNRDPVSGLDYHHMLCDFGFRTAGAAVQSSES